MTYYVAINRLNGRYDFYQLAKYLDERGLISVEYNEGGWTDNMISNALPHLKFDDQEEAMLYVLSYGGKLYSSIPTVETGDQNAV